MKFDRATPGGGFDNHAKTYAHLEARPIASSMGAEIIGIELANLTDDALQDLLDALYRHKVVFMRRQKIDHGTHERFTERLGEFGTDAFTRGVPGHAHVQPVIKEADARVDRVFGGGWHTDSAFLARPPSISTLRSVEVPPFGGDTFFANLALAYSTLCRGMQRMLAPLRVHMSMKRNFQSVVDAGGQVKLPDSEIAMQALVGQFHPIVRTHPESGEKALYVCPSRSIAIEDMTEAESAPILDYLIAYATQPPFTCRVRWEADMFLMWDNRLCLHYACNDYDGHRREMYRTTVMGEVPA